ncbi:MAG: DUF1629 domain-containing protein [Hyphomicrobium sp.]
MAYVLMSGSRDGGSVYFRWEKPLAVSVGARILDPNQPLHPETILHDVREGLATATLLIDRPERGERIPDIMGTVLGPFFVSTTVRDWFLENEPQRHVFYPTNLKSTLPINGKTNHGIIYVMGNVPILDPMDVEQTAWAGVLCEGSNCRRALASHSDAPCVVFKDQIHGHHLWQTSDRQGQKFMCSDEFWEFFKNNKLRGLDATKRCREI